MNEILSLEEVAKILKVSPRTIQREVKAGRIEAFKVGKALRFTSKAVDEYMESQRVKPGDDIEEESGPQAA